ncbi:alginate export family protein [Rhodopirellula sp. MGV]|uniref:alginate export family protein n=1 Tax=Rhodopirellula sp. MGV TaxID=2023130 RepID=UPI000B96877F|nr:alginate export family protein [Rhodopirellula sp. MGV]OYP31631.1 hypothetical protein CGZ80_21015 [Rhodopirellula sp. MGV]PNY33469.1 alginate export family protein [Rhodopirellula baltica]
MHIARAKGQGLALAMALASVSPVAAGETDEIPVQPVVISTDTGPTYHQSHCNCNSIDWSKYPATIHPMPKPGIVSVPPKGPGYYSTWDALTGQCRQQRPKSGYAPFAINAWPFYDSDWRYVESIPECQRTLTERLKRIHLSDSWLMSTGGEFWVRYNNETNSRLTANNNDFTLSHVRQYLDLSYGDSLRVYGEYVWADSFGEDLPPVPPDVDRGDILDLFVDLKLGELGGESVYLRGGRQELLFGSQRMVTPLPWANKRHSFDGFKLFRHGKDYDFDAFWTKYVPPQANDFDTADNDLTFGGLWLTEHSKKGQSQDFYYLFFDNEKSVNQLGITRAPFQTHTFGTRWSGNDDGFLWDIEGAMQFGNQGSQDLVAGMGTVGIGKAYSNALWSPTFWMYYDYASGDNDPTSGDSHTFNQQFPFGHYYLGWMDLVGRQNIHDFNTHLYLYPNKWTTVWLQYHHFYLAEERDALYNAGGAAYRHDPTGAAGNNVGDEIDLVLNFHLTRNSDLLVSYNKLFGGSYLEATANANQDSNAEALYLIFQQRW